MHFYNFLSIKGWFLFPRFERFFVRFKALRSFLEACGKSPIITLVAGLYTGSDLFSEPDLQVPFIIILISHTSNSP